MEEDVLRGEIWREFKKEWMRENIVCVFVWVREMSCRQAPLVWTVRSRCRTAASVCVCVYVNECECLSVTVCVCVRWDCHMERLGAMQSYCLLGNEHTCTHTHARWTGQVIETYSCCVNAFCVGLYQHGLSAQLSVYTQIQFQLDFLPQLAHLKLSVRF